MKNTGTNSTDRDQKKEENMTTEKPTYRRGNTASYPKKHETASSQKQEGKSKEGYVGLAFF